MTTLFVKLGGSLITDKTGTEAVRFDVMARLAREIARARAAQPQTQLLLGHGGGSFGHVAAAQHGTRSGVHNPAQWRGFVEVRAAMARLNRLVVEALLEAGVPAVGMQPSASALCENGRLTYLAVKPLQAALAADLVPVICGDVAFDAQRGGTIISTEEIMVYLVEPLRPLWLLLAGETEGVYGPDGAVIPRITAVNFDEVAPALSGSRGTDVTGGMASKVRGMLDLVAAHPQLAVQIFSGLQIGTLQAALMAPHEARGTRIAAVSTE